MRRPSSPHAESVTVAVEDLLKSVSDLLTAIGAALAATAPVEMPTDEVKESAAEVKAAALAKSAKLRASLKAYWSNMKGKARTKRVAAMLEGRGVRAKRK